MSPCLDHLRRPIVLAPLGGGPSTPELAAAVSSAGGLGFLAAGYLGPDEVERRIARTRELCSEPFGINLFAPGAGPADPAGYAPFAQRLAGWAADRHLPIGQPRWSDDEYGAKVDLLLRQRVPVVSFTFGCPDPGVIRALQGEGAEVWVTVTHPTEARAAQAAGADGLVVQGAEAGGHRGSFVDHPDLPVYGLLPLLALVRHDCALPLVASGGIATGESLAAVLAAGASAAQIGTAFMLCPEAGTSEVHRRALRTTAETDLTRAFTGRLARGIRNEFLVHHGPEAPVAYPEVHYLTAPLRQQARAQDDPDQLNLWAGEAHSLAEERPAADVVAQLAADAARALERGASQEWLDRLAPHSEAER